MANYIRVKACALIIENDSILLIEFNKFRKSIELIEEQSLEEYVFK